jgi:hypothetical protein
VANPVILTQVGVGRSTIWFPDWNENPFNIGVGVTVFGTATYNIEHTFDDPTKLIVPAALASATTLLTFNPSQFYQGGDGAYQRMYVGRPVADLTGGAAALTPSTVASFTTNTVTLAGQAGTGVVAGDLISFLTWFANSGLTAQTGNANGNYAFPVRAISINQTAGTGTTTATLIQATTPQS